MSGPCLKRRMSRYAATNFSFDACTRTPPTTATSPAALAGSTRFAIRPRSRSAISLEENFRSRASSRRSSGWRSEVGPAASASIAPANRLRMKTSLLLLGRVASINWSTRTRRTHEQPASVGEDEVAAVRAIRAVLRPIAFDRDFHTGFDRFAREAATEERVRRAAFYHPLRDGTVGVLHIDVDPRVRVDPLHFRNRALEDDGRVRIELRGERMMRKRRTRGDQREHRHDHASIAKRFSHAAHPDGPAFLPAALRGHPAFPTPVRVARV